MSNRVTRFAVLTGAGFVVALAISIALTASSPGSDASGSKAIEYYRDHRNQQMVANLLGAIASVLFLFFAGQVTARVRAAAPGVAATALAGAAVAAGAGATFSALGFAIADAPDKLDPAAAQALNVLSNDFFFPLSAGLSAFLIAVGLVIVRTGLLVPALLGWIAIVIGAAMVTPIGFIAQMVAAVWVLVVSIHLFVQGATGEPTAAA